jgi:phenylalanyl-tRNA synthetase beta subunit
MKVSYTELQKYFKNPLPSIEAVADALTFHVFEIDGIEGDILDVKVLPNRAADCSTAEGLAYELSAILGVPLAKERELSYDGQPEVEISIAKINAILGTDFPRQEILDVFNRLGFRVDEKGEMLSVTASKPRTDIVIPEDLVEEVGQILGYDRVPETELPPLNIPADQDRFRGIERMKDMLIEKGFTEVSTQTFTVKGDIELANPFDKTKPMLRTSLKEGLENALVRAKKYAPLVLEPKQKPKLFEIGTVFPKSGEYLELCMTEAEPSFGHSETTDNLSKAKLEGFGKGYEPKRYLLGAFQPFSVYPFMLRDIALWVPEGVTRDAVLEIITREAGELLRSKRLFDVFTKEIEGVRRTSYAFNLVFQSDEKTLSDEEVNIIMNRVETALMKERYEVR